MARENRNIHVGLKRLCISRFIHTYIKQKIVKTPVLKQVNSQNPNEVLQYKRKICTLNFSTDFSELA